MIHTYVYTLNAQKNDAGRQEPARPFPYTEEDISFDNKAADIKLAGTLTIPPGKGPFPAVVLIPRSGPLDRDERLVNHRTFFILSDYLTRAGIAVLRSDVRGVGKSGGKYGGAQTDDFASDAEAAIAYLKSRSEVDPHKIGLLSHGDGGLVAPVVATRNPDVAFVVMMGAPAVPSAENSVEATRLNAEGNGELYGKAEEQAAETRKILSVITGGERSRISGWEAARISCRESTGSADGSPDPAVDLTCIPAHAQLRSSSRIEEACLPRARPLCGEGPFGAGGIESAGDASGARSLRE